MCGQDFDGLLPQLTSQVKRLRLTDVVRFEPFLDDEALRTELTRRGVYITASEHEGFGLSVVEAMAAGLIVVCRDMVPLNSFIEHGKSGWLLRFDEGPADRECLAQLLRSTAEDTSRMAMAAREAASAHDWSVVVPRFIGHYRDVLAGATSSSVTTRAV